MSIKRLIDLFDEIKIEDLKKEGITSVSITTEPDGRVKTTIKYTDGKVDEIMN